jgi:hypothetical protein
MPGSAEHLRDSLQIPNEFSVNWVNAMHFDHIGFPTQERSGYSLPVGAVYQLEIEMN